MPERSRAYGDLHGGARLALHTPVRLSATCVMVRRPESRGMRAVLDGVTMSQDKATTGPR